MEGASTNHHVISSLGSHVDDNIKPITKLYEINSCDSTTSTQRQENNDDIILAPDITHEKDNSDSELPSYLEVIKHEPGLNYMTACESHENLPAYSCSVFKAGYVVKKDETVSHGVRAKRRTWRKFYLCLWGTILRIYKNKTLDNNCVAPIPIREFSMNCAKIGFATDYTKRCNVLRIYIATGYQFIFQSTNLNDSISWIEKFQSSVNISSSIDDREMPMFITLLPRFQRNPNILTFDPSTNTGDCDCNELGRNNSVFVEIF
ncbi:13127_t:CDS:2 [Cetraspora pellucida]|uniref:13127_t:CDS:1 n=1 Tax=Cetraspora pellucida TaxID=1433469 RepID=A0A9N9BN88_9GLOM|nr:13127_t:CDS:2 [Cetraspora pellucida]